MTRRATVLVAVAVAVLGVAIGVGIDLVDDGDEAAPPGGSASGDVGVVPEPCVLALPIEDPESVGGGVFSIATVTGDGEPTRIGGEDVATHPDISPDGERIAYVRAIGDYESAGPEATEVWTMGIDGANPTPILADGGYAETPTWSPDGDTIALSRSLGGDPELVTIAAGGSEPAVVVPATGDTDTWAHIDDLTWSPDGRTIAYLWRSTAVAEGVIEVRTVGVADDDRAVRTIAEIPHAATIDWSPDGSSLLVAGGDGATQGLHLVDPGTGEVRDLPQGASLARWSADGARAYAVAARPREDNRWDLLDLAVPRGPGAAPDRTIREVGNPFYGLGVGPTC